MAEERIDSFDAIRRDFEKNHPDLCPPKTPPTPGPGPGPGLGLGPGPGPGPGPGLGPRKYEEVVHYGEPYVYKAKDGETFELLKSLNNQGMGMGEWVGCTKIPGSDEMAECSIKFIVCGCCNDSVEDVLKKLGFECTAISAIDQAVYELNLNRVDIVTIEGTVRCDLVDTEVLEEDVDGIVDMCIHQREELSAGKKLIDKCVTHLRKDKNMDVTLWDFITNELHFKVNGGYDYLLMAYLDTHDIIDHGSGIRCAWLSHNYEKKEKDENAQE